MKIQSFLGGVGGYNCLTAVGEDWSGGDPRSGSEKEKHQEEKKSRSKAHFVLFCFSAGNNSLRRPHLNGREAVRR